MNFELKTTGDGTPRSTTLTLDGQDLGDRAYNVELTLTIPANGKPLLKIDSHEIDENGNFLLDGEGEDRQLRTKTVSYTGSFTITGEVQPLMEPIDGH